MTAARVYTKEELVNFAPKHASFVGIDSDGCVFDTMEIKQKRCFHGIIIAHWHLEPIAGYLREAAEFTNLYSKWRGQNRFVTLLLTFDLLRERAELRAARVRVPELNALRRFVDSGAALSNPALEAEVRKTGDPELASLLKWSQDINREIEKNVRKIPPFPWALKSLRRIAQTSDAICVSQTPAEALIREWAENDLVQYVSIIAGQELGTKAEHIAMAAKGKYMPDKILMIGDAPGDKKAAKQNNALFYPINPAAEDASWEHFYKEAYDRFLNGRYGGEYEERLIADFEARLPDTPPWLKKA